MLNPISTNPLIKPLKGLLLQTGFQLPIEYLGLACLVGSSIATISSIITLLKVNKGLKGLKIINERLSEVNEELNELLLTSSNDGLSKKGVLSLIEAARLLAEDARNLYEWSGEERFLAVARKWEAFVEMNKRVVEKLLGYEGYEESKIVAGKAREEGELAT